MNGIKRSDEWYREDQMVISDGVDKRLQDQINGKIGQLVLKDLIICVVNI